MKSEYVRIYSEEELRHKVQLTSTMLKAMKQKIADDPYFSNIDALTDMWIQYEITRFVISESIYLEDERYMYDPCLFIEREVENDYSDDLKDPSALHNGLISFQFLYDSIQTFLSEHRNIDRSQYTNKRELVLDLATDTYRHFDHSDASEHAEFLNLMDYINYQYLNATDFDEVLIEEVILNEIAKQCKEADTLDKLITTLDLVAE